MKNKESIVTVIVSLLLIVAVLGLIGNTLGDLSPELGFTGGQLDNNEDNEDVLDGEKVSVVGIMIEENLAIE